MTLDDDLDAIVACLDPSLLVVTAVAGGERGGCVVGFHTQSSIEPRRYAVWLSMANHTYRVARRADVLGLHFLTAADHDLASLFGGSTSDTVDKFARCSWEPGPGGVPLLRRCPNRVAVRIVAVLDDIGDHVCFVTEPISGDRDATFTPLHLSDGTDIDAGHDAEEATDGE